MYVDCTTYFLTAATQHAGKLCCIVLRNAYEYVML